MITVELIDDTLAGKTQRWTYDDYHFADESWIRYNGNRIATYEYISSYDVVKYFLDNQPEIDEDAIDYLERIGRAQAAKFLNTYYEAHK